MADECDQEVFDRGTSMGFFGWSKAEAEAYCKSETERTGYKHDWHYVAGRVHVLALLPLRKPEISLSRHSRAMLLNVLWHHQGSSSEVGQPIRALLGIGQHDHMTDEQVAEAKLVDRLLAAGPRCHVRGKGHERSY